jgi:signal transduction histidine kinase
VHDVAVVHADRMLEGQVLPPRESLGAVLSRPALAQLVAIYQGAGRTLEHRKPLFLGNTEFGSIRIGVSTLLMREDLDASLRPAAVSAVAALAVAVIGATLLAQLFLRPIHVIRSGLTRLGRGELGIRLDLNQQDEFGELGTFFNEVSAQLSADRSQMAGQVANLESAVEHLEDAVAMVSPRGELLFANPAMRALVPAAATGAALVDLVPADHPLRHAVDRTLRTRQPMGPLSVSFQAPAGEPARGERLVLTHAISDPAGELVGVMVIARNLEYLSRVQSTIRYSRKLAALGRLSAGVAHEVKNPLNAMMIHLELLRQQFAPPRAAVAARARSAPAAGGGDAPAPPAAPGRDDPAGATAVATQAPFDAPAALQHVEVIAREIRRLDEVVQGFLKFTRPEDLKLQPVDLSQLLGEILPLLEPEAGRSGVTISVASNGVPRVNGDPTMLRQAFLNLGLNACQAMPNGGTLDIRCERSAGGRVAVVFADTGVGIRPEHLQRIFNLYFTTKPGGSGIGLSMVYRIVQMHDGEIEVQSVPGSGTCFTVLLPQA